MLGAPSMDPFRYDVSAEAMPPTGEIFSQEPEEPERQIGDEEETPCGIPILQYWGFSGDAGGELRKAYVYEPIRALSVIVAIPLLMCLLFKIAPSLVSMISGTIAICVVMFSVLASLLRQSVCRGEGITYGIAMTGDGKLWLLDRLSEQVMGRIEQEYGIPRVKYRRTAMPRRFVTLQMLARGPKLAKYMREVEKQEVIGKWLTTGEMIAMSDPVQSIFVKEKKNRCLIAANVFRHGIGRKVQFLFDKQTTSDYEEMVEVFRQLHVISR